MSAILEVRSVSKRFQQVQALDNASFSVPEGNFFGLLGPNGAGKSTLMRLLSSFLNPDSGEVYLKGEPVRSGDPRPRFAIGLVPQELALYPKLTAWENLHIFGRLYQLPRKTIQERAERLLKAVNLWDRRKDRVKTYSGGMQRRLNIIIALLHEPSILLCDEPTVGVDPQSRNAIFDFLEELHREGLTVVYTTHYMEEVERLCEKIAIIDHGRIQATGSMEELLQLSPQGREIFAPTGLAEALKSRLAGQISLVPARDRLRIELPSGYSVARLFSEMEQAGIPTDDIRMRPPSLESIFLHLTGRELRD